MDTGHYTLESYESCLLQLGRLGRLLLGDRASFKAMGKLTPPQSIVDVGCGGGYFTERLALEYPSAEVLGIDISKQAIDFANQRPHPKNLHFKIHDQIPEADWISTTLVCHHMEDDELVSFLKEAYNKAKKALIINDLHRHQIAYCLYALVAPPLFRHPMITHDGLISIKRGFKKKEWVDLLQKASINLDNCHIRWHLPFRWTVTLLRS